MAGVARDYCKDLAKSPEYQGLLAAMVNEDEEAIAKHMGVLDDTISSFAVNEFKRIHGHNLRTDRRTRGRADKLEDPDKMGPLQRAFYEFEKQFGGGRPKSYSSERQFLEGLQRQAKASLPDWYIMTQSELKTLNLSEIK